MCTAYQLTPPSGPVEVPELLPQAVRSKQSNRRKGSSFRSRYMFFIDTFLSLETIELITYMTSRAITSRRVVLQPFCRTISAVEPHFFRLIVLRSAWKRSDCGKIDAYRPLLFFGDKNVMEETERTLRFWRSCERCFLLFSLCSAPASSNSSLLAVSQNL